MEIRRSEVIAQRYSWLHGSSYPAVLAPTLNGAEERSVALGVLLFHLGPGAQQILPIRAKIRVQPVGQ